MILPYFDSTKYSAMLYLGILLCWFSYGMCADYRSKSTNWNGVGDPGEPLFLTPLIESGDYLKAKQLSSVDLSSHGQSLESFSGYLTVDKTYNSNLFFWFFLSPNDAENKPVVLWLQGGPGSSSLFGLFVENGPFYVGPNASLVPRVHSWTDAFNMLYIDQPVGTGFSFTNDSRGYVTNESQVGAALLNALTQFFTLFSEFQRAPFYVTGESYAGKYVPAVAYAIMNSGQSVINLRGLAIGNGAISPLAITNGMGSLLFNYGLVDESERLVFDSNASVIAQLVSTGHWRGATYIFDALMFGMLSGAPSYLWNVTGCSTHYNLALCASPDDNYTSLFATDVFRKALHVGAQPFVSDSRVFEKLADDFMQSSTPQLVALLNSERYAVLLYNGNLDIVCALPFTETALRTDMAAWRHAAEYANATKRHWFIQDAHDQPYLAGYVRSVRPYFYQVAVRNAGHMVPTDQPASAIAMMTDFIAGHL